MMKKEFSGIVRLKKGLYDFSVLEEHVYNNKKLRWSPIRLSIRSDKTKAFSAQIGVDPSTLTEEDFVWAVFKVTFPMTDALIGALLAQDVDITDGFDIVVGDVVVDPPSLRDET